LKKPLQTSIAVETDEFDDIDVEDKLHIVISVKDFRAIIQHAGITGNDVSARYSLPARPIQLTYSGDAITCEFLIMTVGERGSNPAQKTKKRGKSAAAAPQPSNGPRLEAASRRTSVAPSEAPPAVEPQAQLQAQAQAPTQTPAPEARLAPPPAPPASARPVPNLTPQLSNMRASASRLGAFDLRPTQQRPTQQMPPSTLRSESLFVDDDGGWEPVRDEDEEEEDNARLEWDHNATPVSPLCFAVMAMPKLTNVFRMLLFAI
jgi:cell cycle checkpoint control protein RAD9A